MTLQELVARAMRFGQGTGAPVDTADAADPIWTCRLDADDIDVAASLSETLAGAPPAARELLLAVDVGDRAPEPRAACDEIALASGFRRHPLLFQCTDYAGIERESGWLLLPYERVGRQSIERFPWDTIAAERYLHMDMTRAAGRRSDAHLARYRFASERLSAGARILDAACGLGYGSALLRREGLSRRVLGIDRSEWVVDYANVNFGDPLCRFAAADVTNLSTLEDDTFDAVVSFETLEHLLDPEPFLSHAVRVLSAGGVFIASVPYKWVVNGDTGPYHHDWFDAPRLLDLVGRFFTIGEMWVQTAGGGYYCPDLTRGWRRCATIGANPEGAAEWLVIVARRSPAPRKSTTWIALAGDAPSLGRAARLVADSQIPPDAVHVRALAPTWTSADEQALADACRAAGFEFGGHLRLPEDLPAAARGLAAAAAPVVAPLAGLPVISAAPASRTQDLLLAALQPREVRLGRQFTVADREGDTAALVAQLNDAEETRRAARARADEMMARAEAAERRAELAARRAGESLLLDALLRRGRERVWIWGTGAAGRRLLARLRELAVEPEGFVHGGAGDAPQSIDGVTVHTAATCREARSGDRLVAIASIAADQILQRIAADGDWQSTIVAIDCQA